MLKKLTLVLGFGAGYVLGAKAGTQRYEQIVAKARELSGKPAVQDVADNLVQTASTFADTAKAKANETIEQVAAGAPDTVDLTSDSPRESSTGPAPMAGATASDTV